MKYGDTLRQRSIPQWGPYNIDYDEIKHLIKENTTPGNGKAVSIPGQGNHSEQEFENEFLSILTGEHRRIDLFVKSKSGEIERRLAHISKQISQLTIRERASASDRRISEKRRLKYGRIEGDVLKAGEEIKSLSRFVGAQRLGFTKLLKKYKKWTSSESLEKRFRQEVLNQPGTFSRTDLSPLLNCWSDVLHEVRTAYQAGENRQNPKIEIGDALSASNASPTSVAPLESLTAIPAQIQSAAELESEIDLDTALAVLPLGQSGTRATYWVHAEQMVEIQVLLLQSLGLFESTLKNTPSSSPFGSRRNSSEGINGIADNDRTDDIGVLYIDNLERYAKSRSASTVVEQEEMPGKPAVRALGSARWNSSGEAAVVTPSAEGTNHKSKLKCGKLKRKHLPAFLELERPFNSRRPSVLSTIVENDGPPDVSERTPLDDIRCWISSHKDVKPIAGFCAKRLRFVGLDNDSEHGIWATLDTDIHMKKTLHTQLADNDWSRNGKREAFAFPHAVLEVRSEGPHSDELIKTLDKSHLTERIRGFSLEAHAIWTCCKPTSMQSPYWLPMLARDIRKIPEPAPKLRSRSSNAMMYLEPGSSRHTSISNSSVTDGQTSRHSKHRADSSATSVTENETAPQASASKRGKRKDLRELAALQSAEASNSPHGYWNEYDHPEDGSDQEEYVIYVDPYATPQFPGQETLSRFFARIKDSFRSGTASADAPLLHSPTRNYSTVDDSDDELNGTPQDTIRGYGTLPPNRSERRSSERPRRPNALLNLFRPSSTETEHWNPADRANLLSADPNALDSLLSDLELRQRERDATKARFCAAALAASAIILVITAVLASTSRRKLRREVDGVVICGIVADLMFALIAAMCLITRRKSVGMAWNVVVGVAIAGLCLADGALVVWLLA